MERADPGAELLLADESALKPLIRRQEDRIMLVDALLRPILRRAIARHRKVNDPLVDNLVDEYPGIAEAAFRVVNLGESEILKLRA